MVIIAWKKTLSVNNCRPTYGVTRNEKGMREKPRKGALRAVVLLPIPFGDGDCKTAGREESHPCVGVGFPESGYAGL